VDGLELATRHGLSEDAFVAGVLGRTTEPQ